MSRNGGSAEDRRHGRDGSTLPDHGETAEVLVTHKTY